jgi:hypothetical protein
MLLILITLLAAASLAVIISQAENKYAQNQALQTAINSEMLKIDRIALNESSDRPGYVDQVNITIQNLNTDPSQIVTIYLNDVPSKQYYVSRIENGKEEVVGPFNLTDMASIDGGGNFKIILNTSYNSADFLGQTNIAVNHTLTIQVMTRYVNVFNATFSPPNPAVSTRIESGMFNGVVRDYIVLDGSGSSGDRSIVQYNWMVYDSQIKKYYYLSGKVTQFAPDSGGPIIVKLTAINDVGLEAT